MTALTQTATAGPALYQAWQTLRGEEPRLRARDAAERLSVSEGELTASRLGVDAVRLRPEWASLLPALGELGHIMALTRNDDAVHEKTGTFGPLQGGGHVALFVGEAMDHRRFLC